MLPQTDCALAGTGTFDVSRGSWSIATCWVLGSTETTIIVSVLKVFSPGRWSVPTRSTLRRSVPFQGGSVGAGVAPASEPMGVGGASVGLGTTAVSPDEEGWAPPPELPGVGLASAWVQLASVVSPLNTQLTTWSASRL